MDAQSNPIQEDVKSNPIRELSYEECESISGGKNKSESWLAALARVLGEIAASKADQMDRL